MRAVIPVQMQAIHRSKASPSNPSNEKQLLNRNGKADLRRNYYRALKKLNTEEL